MSAMASIAPERDSIRTFLPQIGDEEFALRSKLRSLRNTATALINSTDSDNARALGWMIVEYATGSLYAPGAAPALDEINILCTRLLKVAVQAEQLDLERFAE